MGKDKVIKPSKLFVYSVEERSCTDLICFFIFVALNLVMLGFATYSWANGNFKQLTTAYDPDRKGCGVDYPNYPFIYFASPHANVSFSIFSHYGSPYVFPNVLRQVMPS